MKKNIQTTNERIFKLRKEIKTLKYCKKISAAVIVISLFLFILFGGYAIINDEKIKSLIISFISIVIALISMYFGCYVSLWMKIDEKNSEIYSLGVSAYNSNELSNVNEIYFRKEILGKVAKDSNIMNQKETNIVTPEKQMQTTPTQSAEIRYCYFLKNSIILKKDAECIYNKLKKWATEFIYCLIIGVLFIVTKKMGYDLFIAFEIPLALWILEDLFESYNNEKQINYEKVSKFIEVAGQLYDSGKLKEYQDLQEYFEYLLGIYDINHLEDPDLEPLLPSRYRNKL